MKKLGVIAAYWVSAMDLPNGWKLRSRAHLAVRRRVQRGRLASPVSLVPLKLRALGEIGARSWSSPAKRNGESLQQRRGGLQRREFDDLISLDLRSLSDSLAAGFPASSRMSAGEWLGVVEAITLHLSEGSGDLSREQLATCATALAYALDAAMASGAIDHRETVIRRLHLCGVLLRQVSPDPTIEIVNPDYLVSLLLQALSVSPEEASALASNWRSLDISQIRELRAVKNLLSPGLALVHLFPDRGFVEHLRPWEGVFPSLP